MKYLTLFYQERRRQAINNARKQWEVMQGSVMARSSRMARDAAAMPEIYANHVANVPNGGDMGESEPNTPHSSRSRLVERCVM